jgi:hypothetical protein
VERERPGELCQRLHGDNTGLGGFGSLPTLGRLYTARSMLLPTALAPTFATRSGANAAWADLTPRWSVCLVLSSLVAHAYPNARSFGGYSTRSTR